MILDVKKLELVYNIDYSVATKEELMTNRWLCITNTLDIGLTY